MNIEIEKAILIEDMNRLIDNVLDCKKLGEPWGQYQKLSQICSYTKLVINNSISKLILDNLWSHRSEDELLKDFTRVWSSESWYAFFRLYLLDKAWSSLNKTESTNHYYLSKIEIEQIVSEAKILSDLQCNDTTSCSVTDDGITWETIFDCDDFIKWTTNLHKFLVPRVKSITSVPDNTETPIKKFPKDIKYDENKKILKYGKYIINLTKQENGVFSIFQSNFGKPVSYKLFNVNELTRKQITNTVPRIKQKISSMNSLIEIKRTGHGYCLDYKTK